MKKKSFSLLLERGNVKEILEDIKESGFDGVEPTFHPSGIPSPENFIKDAEILKEICGQFGLEISSMRGGPLFWELFPCDNKEKERELFILTENAIKTVKIMGGDTLLIVPGRWEKGQSYFSTYNKILEKVKKISYIASDMGITIGLENTQSCFLLSPKEWAEFIDEVNSPNIKFYFDIGNVYYVGLGEPSDWIRDLGYRICRIHLKDCLIKKEGLSITRNIVELGMGNIDWKCVKKSLEDIKYNSWFTVELTLPDKNRKEFLKRNSLFIEMVFG